MVVMVAALMSLVEIKGFEVARFMRRPIGARLLLSHLVCLVIIPFSFVVITALFCFSIIT